MRQVSLIRRGHCRNPSRANPLSRKRLLQKILKGPAISTRKNDWNPLSLTARNFTFGDANFTRLSLSLVLSTVDEGDPRCVPIRPRGKGNSLAIIMASENVLIAENAGGPFRGDCAETGKGLLLHSALAITTEGTAGNRAANSVGTRPRHAGQKRRSQAMADQRQRDRRVRPPVSYLNGPLGGHGSIDGPL